MAVKESLAYTITIPFTLKPSFGTLLLSVIFICLFLICPRLTDGWTSTGDPHISSHTHSHLILFLPRGRKYT